MRDFAAALAAAVFRAALILLNELTHLAIRVRVAPSGPAENGLPQYGAALALAGSAWRRTLRRRPA